jgi:hypothetical protein
MSSKLMDERMGHEDGSVQPRYDHITPGMRQALMAALTEMWEEALDVRRAMKPRVARGRPGRPAEGPPVEHAATEDGAAAKMWEQRLLQHSLTGAALATGYISVTASAVSSTRQPWSAGHRSSRRRHVGMP